MGSLDPLRTAVEDLFGNPILFVVLNKASGAVSIRAPNAAVILMCLSRDCIRDLASAYGLLLTKCCLMSEEVPRERSLPRHASKVVTFGSTSLLISLNCCLSTLASSEFPPCVGCICKLYIDNPAGREMGGRYYDSGIRQPTSCYARMGLHHLVCGPSRVALLEKVARLNTFPLDVIVISVVQRAPSQVRSTSTGESWCVANFGVFRLT